VILRATDDGVRVISDDEDEGPATELPRDIAEHVFVSRR
jgi:DtxR family Mn-dependent transcriptional regulator